MVEVVEVVDEVHQENNLTFLLHQTPYYEAASLKYWLKMDHTFPGMNNENVKSGLCNGP